MNDKTVTLHRQTSDVETLQSVTFLQCKAAPLLGDKPKVISSFVKICIYGNITSAEQMSVKQTVQLELSSSKANYRLWPLSYFPGLLWKSEQDTTSERGGIYTLFKVCALSGSGFSMRMTNFSMSPSGFPLGTKKEGTNCMNCMQKRLLWMRAVSDYHFKGRGVCQERQSAAIIIWAWHTH